MKENLASFWQRALAALIDYLISFIFFGYLIFTISQQQSLATILDGLLGYIIWMLWFGLIYGLFQVYLISKYGGSLGKLLTGIKIVNSDGKHLTFWEAFFRETALKRLVSPHFFGLGYFWMIKDKNNQTWHDKALDTLVVKANSALPLVSILLLAALLGLNGFLLTRIYQNIKHNLPVYQEIGREWEKVSQESVKVSPSPPPTLIPLKQQRQTI